jgi:hypothetical protein
LTLQKVASKSNGKVRFPPSSLYADWRARLMPGQSFQECDPADAIPSEHLLQLIWQHQRLRGDSLVTMDGTKVHVWHPGFWNREAGPDFRGAVVQLGNNPVLNGDIEIDLRPDGWQQHHHHGNPAYNRVVLHVVWDGRTAPAQSPPALALKPCLDAPLAELQHCLGAHPDRWFEPSLAGQCSAPLRHLSEERAMGLLRDAAMVRLQAKASQFHARAREAGWDQSLWEGLLMALGYKHNAWPMRRVAQVAPWPASATSGPEALPSIQARLLGVSGLLPADLPRTQTGSAYLRKLWDAWWRERDPYRDSVLLKSLWRLHGIRPANRPERRLAIAAHWLARGDLIPRITEWCKAAGEPREQRLALLELLEVPPDDFWSWHWTLRSSKRAVRLPLLGPQRITDLAMNVVLPWFWTRALVGGNEESKRAAETHYFTWPVGEDNTLLRLARQRLFGQSKVTLISTAAAQQGVLQVVRDFCDHSNALCENCRFPALVTRISLDGA